MYKSFKAQALIGATALTLGALALPGSAGAATYRGKLEPTFGVPFVSTNLSWDLDIQMSLPDPCVQNGLVFNLNCGPMTVDFAKVTLAGVVGSTPTTEVLTFNPTSTYVGAMRFDTSLPLGQELTGAITSPFAPVQSTTSLALYPNSSVNKSFFSLIMLDNQVQLYWFSKNPGSVAVPPVPTSPYVNLAAFPAYLPTSLGGCAGTGDNYSPTLGGLFSGGGQCGWSSNTDGPTGQFITFTLVPEPESYAMALASLGTIGFMGFVSRRRRARTAQ